MYTLVVIMCVMWSADSEVGPRYRCTEVPVVKGYNSIQACEDARQNGKGTHKEAVLYRCRPEGK